MEKLVLLAVALSMNAICFSQRFKDVKIYNDSIFLKVPETWIYHPNYLSFSDYEIVFNGKYSTASGQSTAVLFNVYDIKYSVDTINLNFLERVKQERIRMVSPTTKYFETRITNINGTNVGFFTYTYTSRKRKPSYGAQLFFKTNDGKEVHMNVFSEEFTLKNSKALVDRIVNSLSFKR